MPYVNTIILIAVLGIILFEYRIKKVGQIILYETGGKVKYRKSRLYPRHFSLVIANNTHTISSQVEAEAKGKLGINIRFSVTIAPSLSNIDQLIRIGGWVPNVLGESARELNLILQGYIRQYTEKLAAEEISSESLADFLNSKIISRKDELGVEIISLVIQSVETADLKIAEAIRQKESARILEETEKTNQTVRINTAELKQKANEKIAVFEHELKLKQLKIQEEVQSKEADLAHQKLREELKMERSRLEVEKEEIALLEKNPELLLLSPQVARLAEASQDLRNAKTVVSIGDGGNGSQLMNVYRNFISSLVSASRQDSQEKSS